ncbi:MAG: tRNA (N(6)-L-threonylcarbamoyladenosine(37)-C(2))-methylthiotransferase MtaB [Oscillospiraceae bacterium]|nr:tRNA (N(6)-L-threonylcarbamoyladenosine(37)-C(2))-methylthiotransferase MtaB [Oscillospiraceae bacterium]
MKFYIQTLGCKVNQAESSGLAQVLREKGFEPAASETEAELFLVNSCAVTAESVRKTRQVLRRIRRLYPDALTVLTGCWPQAFPDDDFSEADFVTGTKNRAALLDWLDTVSRTPAVQIDSYGKADAFSELPCADLTKTRAFLKIQDGCNQFCSYCIIPYARGRCRSMTLERLRREVSALNDAGYKEIVLTGINLGFYGMDTGESLTDAVRICAEQENILRVRLGSLEPERMTADQLQAFAACGKFCPQFHLSLQSGSDSVLKRMHRRYTAAEYRALAAEIHRLFPDCALTTDVIVGFPGETDEDFAQTMDFVREIGFAKVHVFPYSVRTGTRAAEFPDQIPQNVKTARAAALTKLANEIRSAHLAGMVGRTLSVLVEGEKLKNRTEFYQGHTPNGTLVKIFPKNPEKDLQNSMICVTIEGYEEDCLTATY